MRDPARPKRPLTGYLRFTQSVRAEVQKETGLKGIKITPIFAKRWNALSQEEKNEFSKDFKEEMVVHREKMAVYKKTPGYQEFIAKKRAKKLKTKKPKDRNAPKRPTSAYFLFANEVRSQVISTFAEGTSMAPVGRKIGECWRQLSAEEKQPFLDQANALKTEYKLTLEAYRQTSEFAAFQDFKEEYKNKILKKKK